jgi:hypothetical protein
MLSIPMKFSTFDDFLMKLWMNQSNLNEFNGFLKDFAETSRYFTTEFKNFTQYFSLKKVRLRNQNTQNFPINSWPEKIKNNA